MLKDLTTQDEHVLVTLYDELTVTDAADLREQLYQKIEEGHSWFIIDMERLSFIDSAGIGILVAIHKRTKERGGHLKIRHAKGPVYEVFEMTRLTTVFDFE
ncbi:STAS domain-containing protein [Salisediminibacterium beveridgei]|uniref:Anti-sigma factor antagonist n=1 Tax=Salisediminibacterium beveridgei TaxID=632773 RepID=A0A1D7QSK6_9BACI|nr:STAS domain-containing protein [Salisediminibacterium beveridgei]AOM81995.1 anti-sigma factor antagonist SpoIIAA-2 / RsbV [Salisediminibacterium beveridgei]